MVREINPARVNRMSDFDYFQNPTKLFKLVEEKDWDKVIDRSKLFSSEASKWIVRRSEDGVVTWRHLPIHEVCIRQPTEDVLHSLIKAYPQGVRATDAAGRLPLHHACVHGASENIIQELLMAYPEAIDVKDVWGKTPLLNVQASASENKDKIIEFLEKRPSYYAVKVAEKKQRAAEEKHREAFAAAFENKFRTAQKKHAVIVSGLEDTIAALRAKVSELGSKLEENVTKQDSLQKEVQSLSETKYDLNSQVKKNNETIRALRESEASLCNVVEGLHFEKKEQDLKIEEMNKKANDDAEIISCLKKKMKEDEDKARNTICDLEGKLAKVTGDKETLEIVTSSEKEAFEMEIQSLKERSKQLTDRNSVLDDRVQADTEEIAGLNAIVKVNNSKIESLTEEVGTLTQSKNSLQKKVQELEEDVNTLSEKKNDLEEQHELDELENSMLKGEVAADKVEIASLEKDVADLTENNMKLNQSVKEFKCEVSSLWEKKEELEKKAEEYSAEIASLKDAIEEDKSEIQTLEKTVTDLTRTNGKLDQTVQGLEVKLATVSKKAWDLIVEQEALEEMALKQERAISCVSDEHQRLLEAAAKQEEIIKKATSEHNNLLESMKIATDQIKIIEAASEENTRMAQIVVKQEDNMKAAAAEHDNIIEAISQQKLSMKTVHSELSSVDN